MIQFHQVHKTYHQHPVFTDINFTLEKGQMAFLMGDIGTGKTTFLKLIHSSEKPTKGQIMVEGVNAHLPSKHQRLPTMALIAQNPLFIRTRSVFDNVATPLFIAGVPKQDIARRTEAALAKLSLLERAYSFVHELSAGEQQCVNVARAIVTRPDYLLADEPTAHVDDITAQKIMHLLSAFHEVGTTILVATGQLSVMASTSCPVFTLKGGQLVEGLPHAK